MVPAPTMTLATDLLVLLCGGVLAGMVGGLLGVGGGVVLMPLLRFGVGLPTVQAAGTCIVAVFFTTLGGSYRHHRLGHVRWRAMVPVMVTGAAATVVFSVLFHALATRQRWLDLGIGLVFSLIAARMVGEALPRRRRPREAGGDPTTPPTPWTKPAIGVAAGALPGLLGIGTGVVLVPAFTLVLGLGIKTAMGCSLACFCCNALISSAFKLAQGFVVLDVALPVCLGTLLGANLGALANKRLAAAWVRLLFAALFTYVAFKFILLFAGG